MSLASETITSLRAKLSRGEITSADIVNDVLAAIEKKNPQLHAYLSVNAEMAQKEAASANLSLPLGGVPIAIKDNINVLGQPCTCASRILKDGYTAPYDATATRKLREAGAIPLGRANLDEFAMGSSTENSAFGPSLNPWDTSRVPGGSSGGSAAAVAGDIAIAALGSDTGGSIRQPAAYCGLVGLKPTYGTVSRFGLVAFASSLDQIGPITKTVEDSALLMNHLAGKDVNDSTSLDLPKQDFTALLGRDIKGLRIGLAKEFSAVDGIHPGVLSACRKR
jgi:aspartyl-tRNA(Asn)/glutamyl-tRNA(Gln) amidotransferase subunit A